MRFDAAESCCTGTEGLCNLVRGKSLFGSRWQRAALERAGPAEQAAVRQANMLAACF